MKDWRRSVPADASGTYYGLMIHRHVARDGWEDAIKRVPEDKQPDANRYLRGIAKRSRAIRSIAGASAR